MHLMRVLGVMLRYLAEVHNRSHPAVDHEVILAARVHHKLWLSGWRVVGLVACSFSGVMNFFDVLDGMVLDWRVLLLLHVCDVQHMGVAWHHGLMRHNMFSVHCSDRPGSEAAEACWRDSSAEPPHRSHPEVPLEVRAPTDGDALPRTSVRLNVSTGWQVRRRW